MSILNSVLQSNYRLDDFVFEQSPPVTPVWAPRVEDSPGLIAAYIGAEAAESLLRCCAGTLGSEISATLWMDEKEYLGLLACQRLRIASLVELARALQDRIFVSPTATGGVLIVDFYAQGWAAQDKDFSVLAQGANLEQRVRDCFSQRLVKA